MGSKKNKGSVDVVKELREKVAKEQNDRAQACAKDIQVVLDKYRCQMDVGMLVTGQGNQPRMSLRTLPEEEQKE